MVPFQTTRLAQIIYEERVQEALARRRRLGDDVVEPVRRRVQVGRRLASLVSAALAVTRNGRLRPRLALR